MKTENKFTLCNNTNIKIVIIYIYYVSLLLTLNFVVINSTAKKK